MESTDSLWPSTIICKSFWTDVKSELLPSQRLRSSQSLVDEKPQHCNLKKLAVMPLPEHHSIRVMSVVLIIKPQTNPCPRPNAPPCRYTACHRGWEGKWNCVVLAGGSHLRVKIWRKQTREVQWTLYEASRCTDCTTDLSEESPCDNLMKKCKGLQVQAGQEEWSSWVSCAYSLLSKWSSSVLQSPCTSTTRRLALRATDVWTPMGRGYQCATNGKLIVPVLITDFYIK